MKWLIGVLLAIGLVALSIWLGLDSRFSTRGQWGLDTALTRHTSLLGRVVYWFRLSDSGVGTVRERDVGRVGGTPEAPGKWSADVRTQFQALKRRGFKIAALASLPFTAKPRQKGNQLPEDLLVVFNQGSFIGREFAGLVDAWEMVGEPDIGYCLDLPDRVAAYQKALYLGLKAGSRAQGTGSSIVLMGALGMPPGPWLERAAANGLLDYADAYNFHFYGHAKDLTGVIEAHRAAISRLSAAANQLQPNLPLWITEAGIETVDKKDFENAQRRRMQADFTISTAKQALAAEDVAVFMPFILAHDKDPYAMTLSQWKTFPAWDSYAKFTRENPWPNRSLTREPLEVNPIVVQWLPDNRTTVPHKVSGTYRFKEGQAIKGKLRIYNFSDKSVAGRLELAAPQHARVLLRSETGDFKLGDALEIPMMGMTSVPLEFILAEEGYFRETWSAAFIERTGRRSPVSFGLEAWAKPKDFAEGPLPLHALPNSVIKFPQIVPYALSEQVGVWTTINGLKAERAKDSFSAEPTAGTKNGRSVSRGDGEASRRSERSRFWIAKENTDPLAPTMAVAAVNGLPASGFIRLQLDKPMTKDRKVLLVLVDDRGQRYSIWENFGADYYGSRNDIWLNIEDFHADFWGHMSADYQFRPDRIREVHLRLYLDIPNDLLEVGLTLLKAK